MEGTYSFYATLTANVFLNDSDFYFLFESFKRHYDRTINASAEVGGFMYGRKVHRNPFTGWEPTDEDRVIEFTSRQLGLVMKCLEMERGEQASRLNMMFHKIASETASSQNFINENINLYTQKTVYGYVEKTK